MAIKKTFPADTAKKEEYLTFLNDSKVDAELYALLLSYSYGVPGNGQHGPETRVDKEDFPTQQQIANMLNKDGIDLKTGKVNSISRATVNNHLQYLKKKGYLADCGNYYQIIQKEKMYFQMPLELVEFFINTVKPLVLKTYIYLGQRYKYKPGYEFTIKEIAEHLGINYQWNHGAIRSALIVLEDLGLISIKETKKTNVSSAIQLNDFSYEIKQSNTVKSL